MVLSLTVTVAPGLGKGLMVKITCQGHRFAAGVVSMVAIYSSRRAQVSAMPRNRKTGASWMAQQFV